MSFNMTTPEEGSLEQIITPQAAAENLIRELEKDPKKNLTESERKNLMRAFFTVRHPRVQQCGHKYRNEPPRHSNCVFCWFAFFQNHGKATQNCDEVFKKLGLRGLQYVIGDKTAKWYIRFMSTLATRLKGEDGRQAVEMEVNPSNREATQPAV